MYNCKIYFFSSLAVAGECDMALLFIWMVMGVWNGPEFHVVDLNPHPSVFYPSSKKTLCTVSRFLQYVYWYKFTLVILSFAQGFHQSICLRDVVRKKRDYVGKKIAEVIWEDCVGYMTIASAIFPYNLCNIFSHIIPFFSDHIPKSYHSWKGLTKHKLQNLIF